MTTWVIDALNSANKQSASRVVGEALLSDLGYQPGPIPESYNFTSNAYAFAVFELLDQQDRRDDLRRAAEMAFEAMRAIAAPDGGESRALYLLLTACYGVLAERTPDVGRFLRNTTLLPPSGEGSNWGVRVRESVYYVWLLLLRKDGWKDLDAVLHEVVALRAAQADAEEQYLTELGQARVHAWELVASYHLSKSAEILATYSAQGSVSGSFNVREQLQGQFDRSVMACERAEITDLYATVRLLATVAERMVANSIWSVTRATNSRITDFVESLIARSQERPIFEMLPPQRIVLREHGLLGAGHRSVVLSLPTSSGKTLIAQFRILQALNQFERERGWVAYIAPTRALVNQICSKLRRDFQGLGIVVERVSPALDIDGVEAELLTETHPDAAFRVLVGTPEKIDLLLRGGWEGKIGRPLTLVIVDEAHNLASGSRGLKLELLLATINRECRQSQFLLLTPFISNGQEIANWLSPDSHTDLTVEFDWRPNDRAIVISQPTSREQSRDFKLSLTTVHTSRNTIEIEGDFDLSAGSELQLTWANVRNSLSNVAAATASGLNKRGPVIVVAGKIPHTWTIARTLARDSAHEEKFAARTPGYSANSDADINFVAEFIAQEYGRGFELVGLVKKRIGLHHSGLSHETRALMEWLVERGQLNTLVATTTIAQGVNFPVTGVVMSAHQYPYGQDMPPEDFWNLAGRAGRADQLGTGIIALAATTNERVGVLREYVARNVSQLNSTLIEMVRRALEQNPVLELHTLSYMREWSAFLQYLAHSYRQIGNHAEFANQIEQVLRGSFGFQKLRQDDIATANRLVAAVHEYAAIIRGKPLALVDSTGFSWESVSRALAGVGEAGIRADSWNADTLFSDRDTTLERAFGVLFAIPEVRDELIEVTGGRGRDGNLLARIVKDWVGGASIPELAREYFTTDGQDETTAITKACRLVYGKLTLTASWGLSALQSLTAGSALDEMTDVELKSFRNLPSRVYYGVSTDAAIDLRLLGVPRNAAQPMADLLRVKGVAGGVRSLREGLSSLQSGDWGAALGEAGSTYQRAWKVLEGME